MKELCESNGQNPGFWEHDDPAWRPLNLESGDPPCDRVLGQGAQKIMKAQGRKAARYYRNIVRGSDDEDELIVVKYYN